MTRQPISQYTPEMGAVLLWSAEWKNPVVGHMTAIDTIFYPIDEAGDPIEYLTGDSDFYTHEFETQPTHFTYLTEEG